MTYSHQRARRDRALGRLGYRVLRVSADDVLCRIESVHGRIRLALALGE